MTVILCGHMPREFARRTSYFRALTTRPIQVDRVAQSCKVRHNDVGAE